MSALCLHGEGTACQCVAVSDKRLEQLIEAWPSLPDSVRQAVEALCQIAPSPPN